MFYFFAECCWAAQTVRSFHCVSLFNKSCKRHSCSARLFSLPEVTSSSCDSDVPHAPLGSSFGDRWSHVRLHQLHFPFQSLAHLPSLEATTASPLTPSIVNVEACVEMQQQCRAGQTVGRRTGFNYQWHHPRWDLRFGCGEYEHIRFILYCKLARFKVQLFQGKVRGAFIRHDYRFRAKTVSYGL